MEEVVSFKPRPLYLRRKTPDTHWIGGCVGPTVGLEAVEKRKICPCKEIKNKGLESKDDRNHVENLCILTAVKHSFLVMKFMRRYYQLFHAYRRTGRLIEGT
jgi:hypothetical protein